MRTIAVVNQKGGCGKTTTAINTAAAFAALGKRVLLIDFDPQAHATIGLGHDPDSLEGTVYDAITSTQIPMSEVIIGTNIELLDLVPCNLLLARAELELADTLGKELVLTSEFRTISDRYSLCIIDCPPSLGILTLNALVASTDVIVPVQAHYYALEGLKRLLGTVHIIRNRFHPCAVDILGLLLTFVENRTLFSRQIQQQMREIFGDLVFDTVIHKTIRLAEAPSAGESVLTYAPESRGAADYRALAAEIINGTTQSGQTINEKI